MASITTNPPPNIETHFTKLQEQQTLLTNCTNLYKTLTHNFTTLQNSIELKSQTLDSNFLTLDSTFNQTLDSLKSREDSIPDLIDSLSSKVESHKTVGLSEVSKLLLDDFAPISETLKSICRRMCPELLTKVVRGKGRKSTTLQAAMSEALSECVDDSRFVVETIRQFVEMKRERKEGLSDKRLACSIVVGGMFPPDELKDNNRVFAKKAVLRAEEVLREWKEVAEKLVKESGGDGSGMGPSEAATFIEMAVGFGLKGKFDEEFYRRLMFEYCDRRDMAKLAISVFGDKVADFIEDMVKRGKEVEAVYFAYESGLTERFQPASLLKSASQKSKMNKACMLKKGHNSQAANDEAIGMEITSIKAIIKCVEDLKIEEQYPTENHKERLDTLLQAKASRNRGSTAKKSKQPSRSSGPPSSRTPKFQKLLTPSPTFAGNYNASPARLSPVSRYLVPSPYAYPSPIYGTGVHVPAAAPAVPAGIGQVTQQYYGVPGEISSSSYGFQGGYAPYDYGATTHAYPPPSYPQ